MTDDADGGTQNGGSDLGQDGDWAGRHEHIQASAPVGDLAVGQISDHRAVVGHGVQSAAGDGAHPMEHCQGNAGGLGHLDKVIRQGIQGDLGPPVKSPARRRSRPRAGISPGMPKANSARRRSCQPVPAKKLPPAVSVQFQFELRFQTVPWFTRRKTTDRQSSYNTYHSGRKHNFQ